MMPPRTDDQAEHFQRGRIFTHASLIERRDAALSAKQNADAQKACLLEVKDNGLKILLADAEKKLSDAVEGDMSKLTQGHFMKLNVDALQVF